MNKMLRVLAYSLILININNVRAEFSFSGGDWKIYRDIGVNGCMDDVHSSYTLNLTVSDSTINGNYNNLPSNDSIFTGKLYSSSSTEGLVLDLLQSGHRPDGSNYNATHTGIFISNNEVIGTWYSVGGDGGDFLLVKSGVTPTTSLHEECNFSSQADIDNTIEQGKQICINDPSSCGINVTGNSNGSSVGTVNSNLDISIPLINYQTLFGTQNIWVNLDYSHENNGDYFWKLGSFGEN